jgi:hypothetical protein
MGSSLSLIHLPAQSGKTRKMTELINRWKHLIDYTGNSTDTINVIFTSNTKLLTKQTAGRIKKEVDDASQVSDLSGDDEDDLSIDMDVKEKESKTLAWISSAKKLSVNDVFAKITSDDDENEINNIICCTNKSRMKNVWELLTKLNKKFMKRNFNKKVNIWIDEADACIKIWGAYMATCEELIDSKFIQNIVLVTATMVPVYKHLHRAGIEPNLRTYENTHAPVYHKYSESELCHAYSENAKYATVQLKAVLEYNPEMVCAGTRLFCPGNKAKKSHEENCDELLANGFNVLLLNGAYKEIRFFDGRPSIEIAELLETDLEVSITLNRLYYEHELFNSPFAVTGNLCIGRGITFASQIDGREFLFTHGIIPEVANGDEGYQMVARCCGNIKGHATYQVPKIFVSERTDALIRVQENLAVEFASKFFQQGVDSMVKVTRGMLDAAIGPDDREEREERRKERVENLQFIMGSMEEFASLEAANQFCKTIKKGSRMEKEADFMNEDGDFVCTTTKKGLKKFTYDDFMSEAGSWNTTSLLNMKDLMAGKVSKVIKPVYRGDEVVWLVRWAVNVVKADGVERPAAISEDALAGAIRDRKCRIESVSTHKFQIVMDA